MKAAIITLHRVYNYGSALQAYATQMVFEKAGFDTVIIDYITAQRTLKSILMKTPGNGNRSRLYNSIYRIAKVGSIALKEMTFGSFVRRNLNLTQKYVTVEDLEADPPKADIYVTGSDQTWNSVYNQGVDKGFFLDFIPASANRVSYVSSFGKAKLDEAEVETTKKYLNRYKAISVREDTAVQIVKELGIRKPVQLIDPTLQVEKTEWERIASKRLVKEPYLVLMLLYNEDNHATEYARMIADLKGLKLVKISWEMKKPSAVDVLFTHRSPGDFLSLFLHADFVVTNSFHGTAFAINFQKQFIVIPRSTFNTRIESILHLCGISERLVNNAEEAVKLADTKIDYEPVMEIIETERVRTREYLESVKKICKTDDKTRKRA